jgi:N-acetylmuramoyl-L-alanine amidase
MTDMSASGGGTKRVYRVRLSPNFGPRPAGVPIDILLLHYTGMESAEAALDRLCDPAAQVSCHWLIEEDGTIWQLVEEQHRAWHAGKAYWAGETDINSRSIGIELVNPGHEHGYRPFPAAQMEALALLAREILARHPIPPHRVLGHSDVAPQRKLDPGELFDWAWLASRGVGIWPAGKAVEPSRDPASDLRRIGYELTYTEPDRAVIEAFQRHFLPAHLSGRLDLETLRRLADVTAVTA